MITIFETKDVEDRFEAFIDAANCLTFRSMTDFDTDIYRAFVFTLNKEEALNLARHILKLYSENG
jgi:hypothetical protein